MIKSSPFDVLRGMDIESVPFRLPRRSQATLAGSVAPRSAGPELDPQRGYEAGLRQGHAEGLRRGEEEGRRQAREAFKGEADRALQMAVSEATVPLKEREARLAALVASLEAEQRALRTAAEDEMVALCYETVCRILGRRAIRPAIVRTHLAHAMSLARETGGLAVHVHPQDAALMQAVQPVAATHEERAVQWVADAEVVLGGCKLVQAGGGIDMRLETALERCKEVLLQARSRRRAHAREAQ